MLEYCPSAVDAVISIMYVPAELNTPLNTDEIESKLSPVGKVDVPCSTALTVIALLLIEQNGPIEKDIASFVLTV